MEVPLGRAVLGGLVMSTFATLLILPAIFSLVIGARKSRSPSLYPENPESKHYDPDFWHSQSGENGEQKNGEHSNGASHEREEQAMPAAEP